MLWSTLEDQCLQDEPWTISVPRKWDKKWLNFHTYSKYTLQGKGWVKTSNVVKDLWLKTERSYWRIKKETNKLFPWVPQLGLKIWVNWMSQMVDWEEELTKVTTAYAHCVWYRAPWDKTVTRTNNRNQFLLFWWWRVCCLTPQTIMKTRGFSGRSRWDTLIHFWWVPETTRKQEMGNGVFSSRTADVS